jgi:hypothetical protein
VSSATLLYVLQSQGWHVSSQVERFFENLAGNYVPLKFARNMMASVLKNVWLGTLLFEQKVIILDLCLGVLVKDRNPIKAIQYFVNNLTRLLQYLDNRITKEIPIWG